MESELEHVRAVRKAHIDELMQKANVIGVGVGYFYQGGIPTQQLAVIVMVRKKIPVNELLPEDILPTQLDGVPVDVREVGEIQAQA